MCEGNHKGCSYGWAPFVLRTFPPRSGGNPALPFAKRRGGVRSTQGMHEIHRSSPATAKLSSPITTPP